MTNSPIERYNGDIKESFTKRLRHHLKSSMETFEDVISYESNHQKSFKHEFVVRKYIKIIGKRFMINLWNKLVILNKDLKMKDVKENKKKKNLLQSFNQFNLKLEITTINNE